MCLILSVSATWLGVGLAAIIATTFIILLSCSKEEVKSNLKYDFKEDILSQKETDFLSLIDEYRMTKWLCTLEADALAGQLAYEHNMDMILDEKASHDLYPERQRILMNHGALNVGEIVGYGYHGIQGAYRAFLASDEHIKHIKGDYNAVGIDIMADDNGKDYYTIIFIKI